MIYLDTSVVLAHLLAEDRQPPPQLWAETLVSSRLLEHEAWTRIHDAGLRESHGDALRGILARVAMLELHPSVLQRALDPFPTPVRTLDSLHLASACFLRDRNQRLSLATYDTRMEAAAAALAVPIYRL